MLETQIVGRADRAPSLLRCADLRLQSAAPTRIRAGNTLRFDRTAVACHLRCTVPRRLSRTLRDGLWLRTAGNSTGDGPPVDHRALESY